MILLSANNANTILAAALTASTTTIIVEAGAGALFPSPAAGQFFTLTLNDALTENVFEICWCTSRTGDSLTVMRGQEGTSARAWLIGDFAYNTLTAGGADLFVQGGPFVLLAAANQTVTGNIDLVGSETVSGNVIAGGIVQGATLQLPRDNQLQWTDSLGRIAFATPGTMFLSCDSATTNVTIDGFGNIVTPGGINASSGGIATLEVGTGGATFDQEIAIGCAFGSNPAFTDTSGLVISASPAFINSFGSSWFLGGDGSTGGTYIEFLFTTTGVGSITFNSATGQISYNTTSDARLKTNIEDLGSALSVVNSVKARRYTYKQMVTAEKPGGSMIAGFLAHEVAQAVPEAVIGEENGTQTLTNVVIGPKGNSIATGVTQAEFATEMAKPATVTTAGVVKMPNGSVVATGWTQEYFTAATTPTAATKTAPARAALLPAGSTYTASVTSPNPRSCKYPAGSTWAATLTEPVYQKFDATKLVPYLWAAIQELVALRTADLAKRTADVARIATLESTVASLVAEMAVMKAAAK